MQVTVDQLQLYADTIKSLHEKWTPHAGQIVIGQKLFKDGVKKIFVQCGRKFGKTELCAYILWRVALTTPGANLYYICPTFKLAKEIIWASKRLQNFGPVDQIQTINNTELRITFKNGSFIKLEGSDNVDSMRGITPHGVVYDEFKDIHPDAYVSMLPNLLPKKAFIICIGTPPKVWDHYMITASEYKEDPDCAYFHMPTSANPHIDKTWLEKERLRLIKRGEVDEWITEYEARFVRGGKKKIFPMLSEIHNIKHSTIMAEIEKDKHKFEFWCVADPGSASCFAVLFACCNPYTKKIYILDQLYVKKQEETSTRKMWPRIREKINELADPKIYGDVWRYGADNAATWLRVEMMDQFNIYFEPTEKSRTSKKEGISLMKDVLLFRKLVMSDRCVDLYGELDAYMLADNGEYVKKDDHLIDCLRYYFYFSNYSFIEARDPALTSREDAADEYDDNVIYREPYLFELDNEY